jgi:hypothetical protein
VGEDGSTTGNPSLAPSLAAYMLSLQRRKVFESLHLSWSYLDHFWQVRAGDVVTSARAITHDIIKKLYESNEAYSATHSVESLSKHGDALDWGNAHTRSMLHFCYLIMFWCLLRYDEALGLEFHQVQLCKDDLGIFSLEVQLPFRKTHQTGSK